MKAVETRDALLSSNVSRDGLKIGNKWFKECLDELDQLESDAELGRAVRMAFKNTDKALFLAHWQDGEDGEFYVLEEKSLEFDCEEELLEWARGVE
jgi:hypothetical protein